MELQVSKFDVPKGMEDSFGSNPSLVLAKYESDLGKGEYAVLEYEFFLESAGQRSALDEFGTRVISDPGDVEVDFVHDPETTEPGSRVVMRYRLFTLESTCGPQIEAASFETKVPSKGKIELPLSAPVTGTLEMQPGGYANAKFSLSSTTEGDWCLVATIADQDGDSKSSAEIADDGSASLSIGMAGKPKSLNGTVSALGANQWCEVEAPLPPG